MSALFRAIRGLTAHARNSPPGPGMFDRYFGSMRSYDAARCRQVEFSKHRRGKSTIAVAISGGVDSAVAALLLKQQGHELFGVFMRNWDESEELGGQCSANSDQREAERVCQQLNIPLHVADFVSSYWNDVFVDFLDKCRRGLTPNPDLACNRHIKFDALLSFARALGAEKVATGHYARLRPTPDGQPQLLRGVDTDKDQSYFLASVRPGAFTDVLFPLGALTKAQVRSLAQDAGLRNASRRSSAGICFIGRRRFSDFLASYAEPLPGEYVDVDSGTVLGHCSNIAAVTYGQRAAIGGSPGRLFVVGKNIPGRQAFVALGHSHPALYCRSALLSTPSWLSGMQPRPLSDGTAFSCSFKSRYRQAAQACSIQLCKAGEIECSHFTVLLPEDRPSDDAPSLQALMPGTAHSITPQQEFVMYDGDVCLGSAPITYPGKTLAEGAVGKVTGRSLHIEHHALS